jgi:hypothetical protein
MCLVAIVVGIIVGLLGCQGPEPYYESMNHAQVCEFPPSFAMTCENNPGCSICYNLDLTRLENIPELGCTFERNNPPGRNLCVQDCMQCELDPEDHSG